MIERVVPAGDGWLVRVRCSQISEGDFRCDRDGEAGAERDGSLDRRRQRLMSGQWTWLRQVHGADVVFVNEPGGCAGKVADGAVTAVPAAVLALHTADCAPVVVAGSGALGVAHAGWRGIVAGVIGRVVDGVRRASPPGRVTDLRAVIGPVIRPSSYEFGVDDLAAVAAAAGCDVSGSTSWGTPALDLGVAVLGALNAAGVRDVEDLGFDTARDGFFSHRVRGDRGRQATAARLERR
ncbi:MAG: polyphenol oxidase family protein [Acidimicrobiaceae bacterium]|nr:polyphenol oxidase family protein [Acidimicrobiaceae bacterium]MCY3643259.1 polyphenol oxidase family protein [Acidimicrobiaceae bacterium]MDE0666283.1 polyphenol oxidase family protein [Acidimicrobiaceae bacterium]MXW89875.1 polyphenol oxidase family protein [Acidimicrobiaceae bacterium]MYE57586.1 polyphenol oxidase family protein [Acidimicrobiaceae bacterium]